MSDAKPSLVDRIHAAIRDGGNVVQLLREVHSYLCKHPEKPQPIETAPKGLRYQYIPVLLFDGDWIVGCWDHGREAWVTCEEQSWVKATHWMPLPPKP